MSIRSDIAIDDVKFQAGPCEGNIFPNYIAWLERGFYHIVSRYNNSKLSFLRGNNSCPSFLTEMEDTSQQSSGYSEDLNEIDY